VRRRRRLIQWFFNDRFAPEVDEALMFHDSDDGSLPLGLQEWSLTDPDDKTLAGGATCITVKLQ